MGAVSVMQSFSSVREGCSTVCAVKAHERSLARVLSKLTTEFIQGL